MTAGGAMQYTRPTEADTAVAAELEKSGKSSIMDRLKTAKAEPQQEKPTPHKERKNDREL